MNIKSITLIFSSFSKSNNSIDSMLTWLPQKTLITDYNLNHDPVID